MSRIVNQLLLVARLETMSNLPNETVDLLAIATDVAGNLAPLAIASGKHLEILDGTGPIFVQANAEALRAALTNLVENALSHTPSETTVSIRLTQEPTVEVVESVAQGCRLTNAIRFLSGSGRATAIARALAWDWRSSSIS